MNIFSKRIDKGWQLYGEVEKLQLQEQLKDEQLIIALFFSFSWIYK